MILDELQLWWGSFMTDWIFVRCVKENKFKYAGLDIPDWMRGKL